jgi:hypothetical protein
MTVQIWTVKEVEFSVIQAFTGLEKRIAPRRGNDSITLRHVPVNVDNVVLSLAVVVGTELFRHIYH